MATKERKEYKEYHRKFELEYHNFVGGVKDKYRTEWGLDPLLHIKKLMRKTSYLKQRALDSEQREYEKQNLSRGMFRQGIKIFIEWSI